MNKTHLFFICIFIIGLSVTSGRNVNLQAKEAGWKYAKHVYIGWELGKDDMIRVYWYEECTIYAGNQCAQSGGKFRTLMAIFPIPKIGLPNLPPIHKT
ncbi:hypothetical protein [Roseivirga sp. E12]|uniref:hypothetical protein n=1 Tax=Roseivirga sp. E12 TaxID=2819237 RepID=UPI001ABC2D60|nr:hypothetical protein [Roseivirga sp. E12]MBO3699137.1 hypothetical protein [Roseivirga sp. E12]